MERKIQIGDRVNIDIDVDFVRRLQEGHGGWDERMCEAFLGTGVVLDLDNDADALVIYPSGKIWTINPAVLTKLDEVTIDVTSLPIHMRSSLPSDGGARATSSTEELQVGDFVRLSMRELAKTFQERLERLMDGFSVLGVGIVKLVFYDKDVAVECFGNVHFFNPLALVKILSGSSKDRKVFETKLSPEASSNGEFNEELVRSAAVGNFQKCEEVLSSPNQTVNGVSIRQKALHYACWNNHIDVAKLLIKAGASLEHEHKNGNRAIHDAAMGGAANIIALLKEEGTDMNSRNKLGCTPLHIAVYKGHADAVRTLLTFGGNPNLQGPGGDTPLHTAISCWRDDIVELLLISEADVTIANDKGLSSLHDASIRGNPSVIRALLKWLPRQSTINEAMPDGDTALHLAAINGHQEIVRQFAEHGADLNPKNKTGVVPLHLAVCRNRFDTVKVLLEEGCDPNAKDNDGNTALHIAAMKNLDKIGGLLLDKGSNMTAVIENGNSALHLASCMNHLNMAQFLILVGKANVDLSNEVLSTPLHLAVQELHHNMVELLVDAGSNVNVKHKDGGTLHCVILNHHSLLRDDEESESKTIKIAKTLVSNGADLDILNGEGQSPLSQCGSSDLRQILVECHQILESTKPKTSRY